MHGKALWKMFRSPDEKVKPVDSTKPTREEVLDAFTRAVEALPDRESRKDPIIEPHYKIVSVVHKLVASGAIEVWIAANLVA
jgi:hypothetical protein